MTTTKTLTLAQITSRADIAEEHLRAIKSGLAEGPFADYESLTRLLEQQADYTVWSNLQYLAETRRTQGEHVHDTDEQVCAWLATIIQQRVFGFFGNRSTNAQSNEAAYVEHLAWIRVGREIFGLGRGW
jgi:hypothetical protein